MDADSFDENLSDRVPTRVAQYEEISNRLGQRVIASGEILVSESESKGNFDFKYRRRIGRS